MTRTRRIVPALSALLLAGILAGRPRPGPPDRW